MKTIKGGLTVRPTSTRAVGTDIAEEIPESGAPHKHVGGWPHNFGLVNYILGKR